jgi:hypothetical protein
MQVTGTYTGGSSDREHRDMSDAALAAPRTIHLTRDVLNDGYTDQTRKRLTDARELLDKAAGLTGARDQLEPWALVRIQNLTTARTPKIQPSTSALARCPSFMY